MNNNNNNNNNDDMKSIIEWLESINYGVYTSKFESEGFDLWDTLYDLTVDEIQEIGVKIGHAKRIIKLLKKKKEEEINNQQQQHKQQKPRRNNDNKIKIKQEIIETNRKIREKFEKDTSFAKDIKSQLFETVKGVLNYSQFELITYNQRFAKPLNDMNKKLVALQKVDLNNLNNLDGIWDQMESLYQPLFNSITEIQQNYHDMFTKMKEFNIKAGNNMQSLTKSIQDQINTVQSNQLQQKCKNNNNNNNINNHHKNKLKTKENDFSAKINPVLMNNLPILPPQLQSLVGNNINNIFAGIKSTPHQPPPLPPVSVTSFNSPSPNRGSRKSMLPNCDSIPILEEERNININNINNNTNSATPKIDSVTTSSNSSTPTPKRGGNTRKPAYTQGELKMMKNFNKKKQTVKDIVELQQKMQSIHGIPRSAYGVAQKMYRMGVLAASIPKKLQVQQKIA